MITKQEAIEAREFHVGCSAEVGRRGGIKHHQVIYRRTGVTKLWKTRPTWFMVPTKRGLYDHVHITHHDAQSFYTDKTCPVCSAVANVGMGRFARDELRKELAAIMEGG